MKGKTFQKKMIMALAVVMLLLLPLFCGYYVVHILIFSGINLIAVSGLGLLIGFSRQVSLGHAAFYGISAYASALLTLRLGLSFWSALPLAGILV